MKFYICRPGRVDFVCHAATVAEAIVLFWLITRETPVLHYRIHQGRRMESQVVSSAVAFWELSLQFQDLLADLIRETSTRKQFIQFCETAIEEI